MCVFVSAEDRFGRAGRVNTPKESDPAKPDRYPGTSNWSELEPMYKLDEHAYDLKPDFNISLEDWTNFSSAVDRMFALLSNDNQPDLRRRPLEPDMMGEKGGRRGGGHALVSSTSQSASAIYLTTLATPALLLREAGAGALREALGLNRAPGPSSSSSSSSSATSSSSSSNSVSTTPLEEERGTWEVSSRLLDQFLEENKNALPEEEEEEDDEEEGGGKDGATEVPPLPL